MRGCASGKVDGEKQKCALDGRLITHRRGYDRGCRVATWNFQLSLSNIHVLLQIRVLWRSVLANRIRVIINHDDVCVPGMQDIFDIQRRPSLQELIADWPKLATRAKEKVRLATTIKQDLFKQYTSLVHYRFQKQKTKTPQRRIAESPPSPPRKGFRSTSRYSG